MGQCLQVQYSKCIESIKTAPLALSISTVWSIQVDGISAINLRMMFLSLVPFVAAVALAAPGAIEKRSVSGNAAVNLNVNTGTPQHLASGFIYGIPDTANQIPSSFYSEIDFGYGRAGGAQVASPGLGWIWGLVEYKVRESSFLELSDVCLETSQILKPIFRSDLAARCLIIRLFASKVENSFS